MKHVTFNGTLCDVVITRYHAPNNLCIQLIEHDSGMPFAIASVNVLFKLPDHLVAIKIWSENDGILEVLIDAGIVTLLTATMAGTMIAPLVELHPDLIP